jgi:hypothetical protein
VRRRRRRRQHDLPGGLLCPAPCLVGSGPSRCGVLQAIPEQMPVSPDTAREAQKAPLNVCAGFRESV